VNARALGKLPPLPGGAAPRPLAVTEDISLIVADVPADLYRAETVEARLGDLDWVGRCGSAHHAVADALVTKHTVAPLRPFTLFSSEARAAETFRALSNELDAALRRVSGKAEWVLRIGKPDPSRLRSELKENTPSRPASGASFLAQKAAAKRSAADRAARVRQDAATVFEALANTADQSTERPPDPATGLLLDAAFLVPVSETLTFKRLLESTAAGLLRDGCRVSLTGPWPPYSFVSLNSGRARD